MALIPPFFLDSTVAIGLRVNEGQSVWLASGLLYGRVDPQKITYHLCSFFFLQTIDKVVDLPNNESHAI
jgi:hypothetical protein